MGLFRRSSTHRPDQPLVGSPDPRHFIVNGDLLELSSSPHLWNIDSISVGCEETVISGWCLPIDGLLGQTQLVVNGRAYDLDRQASAAVFAELYPWHPNAVWSSYRLAIPHHVQDLRLSEEITVQPRSRGTSGRSSYPLSVLVADLAFEMPPADIAARIGATNLVDFVVLGRSIYRGFDAALKSSFGTSFASYQSILDWGCGSGRVARHVRAGLKPSQRLAGYDIDSDAVEWANAHVGNMFNSCSVNPPLEIAEGGVDLAYAYSVFTHLAEQDLRAWSAELARVVKPGGVSLFSVLSDGAMAALYAVSDRAMLTGWAERGIYDSVANAQLDTIDVAKEYYRNVWLKKSYIHQEFGRYFDVVDVVDGFHFYQDLVVARRR